MTKPRPVVDENLCFICQEKPPINLVTTSEQFKLCEECTEGFLETVKCENNIKKVLKNSNNGAVTIYEAVLGWDLRPFRLPDVKKL